MSTLERKERFDWWWQRLGEMSTRTLDNRSIIASEICDLEVEVERLRGVVRGAVQVVQMVADGLPGKAKSPEARE